MLTIACFALLTQVVQQRDLSASTQARTVTSFVLSTFLALVTHVRAIFNAQ